MRTRISFEPAPLLPQKIVQPYTVEEIERLLASCDTRFYWGARNRAMILVLLNKGVRRTELVDLDLADLDLEGQRLRVLHGKGNKQRVVRFGSRAREAVEDYLERFWGREPGPVFLSTHGDRMSSHSVLIFLRRLGRRAGVKKVKLHRFRHTFATWAVENEARELDVQHLLEHSTPAIVRRYSATYDAQKAARAHERFSPADRLNGRLHDGGNGSREPRSACASTEVSLRILNLRPRQLAPHSLPFSPGVVGSNPTRPTEAL